MKKLICLICALVVLALAILIPVVIHLRKPPKYEEIEGRLKELVEASYEVNELFFGEGLDTYERIYDAHSSLDTYSANENGETVVYQFYEVTDEKYERVVAFKTLATATFRYVEVLKTPDDERELFYENTEKKAYCYLLENYEEPKHDFYYSDNDPTDYDYVRLDGEIQSVSQIKAMAEAVYSTDYLSSIYDSMFVGTVGAADSVDGLSARYIEYSSEGVVYLMESNSFEPLITERRVYDFSTAEIVRPSNKKQITVEIDSYLPSNPDRVQRVRLSLTLQDGVWMLDSATY